MFLRGYIGWNSRMALEVYKKIFPKEHCRDRHKEIQPSLVILYFGGNDSQDPDFPNSSHVPLHEYVENMRKLAHHIQGLSEKTRLIMLSAPAVNEEQILKTYGDNRGRSNEVGRKYAEAGVKLGQELSVPVINFFEALYRKPGVFLDGMHLTADGSKILFDKIKDVIKNADWEPTLDWDKMPTEYADIGTDMHLEMMIKETKDKTIGITDSDSQELKP
ncbi:hypothetical protein CQW23_24548 [Capsicum baccatum]|uniref:SGNH hydrolase-type esterase domain-containing protein n=1 Tax=Capsicum baccatum TaxID=33114 RepID=A0A2G2VV37_CAPBA|nr:hypothetical protein CQW23_24548 [Capsicum baccatum]